MNCHECCKLSILTCGPLPNGHRKSVVKNTCHIDESPCFAQFVIKKVFLNNILVKILSYENKFQRKSCFLIIRNDTIAEISSVQLHSWFWQYIRFFGKFIVIKCYNIISFKYIPKITYVTQSLLTKNVFGNTSVWYTDFFGEINGVWRKNNNF